MDKRFLAVIGAIIVIFIGFLVFRNDNASAPNAKGTPSNHIKGDGAVKLVEYGDFQCPACGQYYPVVTQVVDKYSQDITFQFRNNPLVSIHPNAFAGSRAAEAASKQGKFWEMYDKLFGNQQDWSSASNPMSFFETYAKQLGLNVDQFKKDFASSAVNDTINADLAQGKKIGVKATPTFELNGKVIENPQPTLEAFSKVLDEAIAEKKQNN
jgi:protein-disulfide isomerase